MKLLLLSKADIFGNINLNILLSHLAGKHEIQIMLSDEILPIERENKLAQTMTYYERDYFIDYFLPCIDNNKISFTAKAKLLSFKALEKKYAIPFYVLDSNEYKSELLNKTLLFQPDIIFCCRFDYIIPKDVLNIPPYGAYNTHSGLLPTLAGSNAAFWAMQKNLKQTACSIHFMNEKIDAGNIIAQPLWTIDYSKSIQWNRIKIYKQGLYAFLEFLPQLLQKKVTGKAQNLEKRKYYPYPNYENLLEFTQAGKKIADFEEYNKILQNYFNTDLEDDRIIKTILPPQKTAPITKNIELPR